MKKKLIRRTLAACAIVAGALLMWLSPEVLGGAILLSAGVVLEILGIWLEHRR
ncbi:MAG TPA: hypothetical protein VLV56_05675 [Burkholderiales bacterium]|nr:hypothetical protein [Burkholderiales bacterium]